MKRVHVTLGFSLFLATLFAVVPAAEAGCVLKKNGSVAISVEISGVPAGTPITVENATDSTGPQQVGQVLGTGTANLELSSGVANLLKISEGDTLVITAGNVSLECRVEKEKDTPLHLFSDWRATLTGVLLLAGILFMLQRHAARPV